jgi:hypothetical protein
VSHWRVKNFDDISAFAVKEMPGNASPSSLKQSGNQRLLKLGLDEAVCNDILNPGGTQECHL